MGACLAQHERTKISKPIEAFSTQRSRCCLAWKRVAPSPARGGDGVVNVLLDTSRVPISKIPIRHSSSKGLEVPEARKNPSTLGILTLILKALAHAI